MKNKERFGGIIPPLVTPLLPDETLDVVTTKQLIEYLIQNNVNGIFVNGTSGEAMRVTESVWEGITRLALETVNGRVPVFCGAIDTSTLRVIERIRRIEAMGGELVVCTPPFYLKSFGQDEILRHYDKICSSVSKNIQIAVYNIPSTTGANIEPETIAKLADYDNIVAYKDSCADFEQVQHDLFQLADKDICMFNGAEDLCAASMLFGAQGCIPGLANFYPELFVRLYQLCRKGEVAESVRLQEQISEIRKCLHVGTSWMAVMKYLLKREGFGHDTVSSPIPPLNDEHRRSIDTILERAGVSRRER